jgi:hypothetical protein
MTVKQSRTAEQPYLTGFWRAERRAGRLGTLSGAIGEGPAAERPHRECFTFYLTVKQSRTGEQPPPAPGSASPGAHGRGSGPTTGRPARVFHVLHDGETVERVLICPGWPEPAWGSTKRAAARGTRPECFTFYVTVKQSGGV